MKARYMFYVREIPEGEIFIALESTEAFSVYINGKPAALSGRTYKDRAFALLEIKHGLKTGLNEIVLDTDEYGLMLGFESIYVVGDFRVDKTDKGFVLSNEDRAICTGDWTVQGYPYYSGVMRYKAVFDLKTADDSPVVFEMGKFLGAAAKVQVNGSQAAILGWEPYRVELTSHVHDGINEIVVEVMNSLQNLLGPHHYLNEEGVVTPDSFYCRKDVKFAGSGFDGKGIVSFFKNYRGDGDISDGK